MCSGNTIITLLAGVVVTQQCSVYTIQNNALWNHTYSKLNKHQLIVP